MLEVYTLIVAVKFLDVLKDYEKRMGETEPVEQVHLLTYEQEKILIEPS